MNDLEALRARVIRDILDRDDHREIATAVQYYVESWDDDDVLAYAKDNGVKV